MAKIWAQSPVRLQQLYPPLSLLWLQAPALERRVCRERGRYFRMLGSNLGSPLAGHLAFPELGFLPKDERGFGPKSLQRRASAQLCALESKGARGVPPVNVPGPCSPSRAHTPARCSQPGSPAVSGSAADLKSQHSS